MRGFEIILAMALSLSPNLLIVIGSFLLQNADELSLSAAKQEVIAQYKMHQAEQEAGAKSASFEISENGFVRYRRINNDKTEYYSVKLDQLKDLEYLGDETKGWLVLKFPEETVIYQTYNDKNGNVDEMLEEIKIPMKNVEVSQLNRLQNAIEKLKQSF
ncbi:hypothetical protein BCY91_15695 [Pelobium manganitolerans]|uniref:Uncharacterized protein n=1 Tax=Pelobium manganitolerans TaxID=1842495 RepID=A0A419S8Y7_9SPHI|nr:hypothetical protein [Pelobium manganitolerans]RKD18245.1 hypothetical protein BCY91_15695 [Pelobium manganitolerans]